MKLRSFAVLVLAFALTACGSPLDNASSQLMEQVRLGDPLAEQTYAENQELLESQEALPIWLDALRDNDSPQVRQWAARMLGNIGDAEALPALADAMSDSRDVRDAAVAAIRQFPDEQAAEAYVSVLEDGSRDAKALALARISRLEAAQDQAVPAVAGLAAEGDDLLAQTAINTLGDIANDEAATALGDLAVDESLDDGLRSAAIINLGRIESPAADEQVIRVVEALSEEEGAEELLSQAQDLQ